MLSFQEKILADILLHKKMIDVAQAKECAAIAGKSGKANSLVPTLVDRGYITIAQITPLVKEIQQRTWVCRHCSTPNFLQSLPANCSRCGMSQQLDNRDQTIESPVTVAYIIDTKGTPSTVFLKRLKMRRIFLYTKGSLVLFLNPKKYGLL